MKENHDWQTSEPHIFWGEIAPTEHVVQIYEDDEVFLDSLETFVTSGFRAGECVIIIATTNHLSFLKERLNGHGFNATKLSASYLFVPLDAQETLDKFMVNGWPDAELFHLTVSEIIKPARAKGLPIRAFGEMVALLWSQGMNAATIHLENLWNRFCHTEAFCLFCAYPKSGFTQDVHSSFDAICCAHSKMISGEHKSKTEIFYKTTQKLAS